MVEPLQQTIVQQDDRLTVIVNSLWGFWHYPVNFCAHSRTRARTPAHACAHSHICASSFQHVCALISAHSRSCRHTSIHVDEGISTGEWQKPFIVWRFKPRTESRTVALHFYVSWCQASVSKSDIYHLHPSVGHMPVIVCRRPCMQVETNEVPTHQWSVA